MRERPTASLRRRYSWDIIAVETGWNGRLPFSKKRNSILDRPDEEASSHRIWLDREILVKLFQFKASYRLASKVGRSIEGEGPLR